MSDVAVNAVHVTTISLIVVSESLAGALIADGTVKMVAPAVLAVEYEPQLIEFSALAITLTKSP
jgi:hypothetical protein